MQRQRNPVKFPIIRPHQPQPKKANDLDIFVFRPGLLRIRFDNPHRVVSTTRYRARRQMAHILEKYFDKLADGREPERMPGGRTSARESYLVSLRNEFLAGSVDYWMKILSGDNALRFLEMWEGDAKNQKRVFQLLEQKELAPWLFLMINDFRKRYDVSYLEIAQERLETDEKQARRFIKEYGLALGTMNPFLVLEEIRKDMPESVVWYLQEAEDRIKKERYDEAVVFLKELKNRIQDEHTYL